MVTASNQRHEPVRGLELGLPKDLIESGHRGRKRVKPIYDYFWVWSCSFCGKQGGMSTKIPQCPDCYHHRCSDCPLEEVRFRNEKAYSVQSPPPHRPGRPSLHPSSNEQSSNCDSPRPGILASQQSPKPNYLTASISTAEIFAQNNSPQTGAERSRGAPLSISAVSPSSSRKSPNPSGTFSPTECSMGSYTELESISGDSEEDYSDDDAATDDASLAIRFLESRLLSVLRHNLNLAARLIPQIHHQVQSSLTLESTHEYNDIPSDGNGATSKSAAAKESLNKASSNPANSGNSTHPRKHGRESDQNDDQSNGSPKKSRSKLPDESDGHLNFACHFHKRFPGRYNPHKNRKYLHCICPLKTPELRRIKDHFGAVHRPSQCDRCYAVFKDIDELQNHRQAETACPKRSPSLREGIDDSQWQRIDKLLKVKRGTSPSDRPQHEIEKWFGVWHILFPGIPQPEHPWNVNTYDQSESLAIDADGILSIFEEEIDFDLEEGRLQRDNGIHMRYMRALRIALSRTTLDDRTDFSLGFDHPDSTNNRHSPSSNRLSSNTIPTRQSAPRRQIILSDGFGQTGNFQGATSHPPPDEIAMSQSYASASGQAPRSPTSASLLDVNMDFAASSSLRYPSPPSPSPSIWDAGTSWHAAQISTAQVYAPQTELNQHPLEEAILGYNPDMTLDDMEFSPFNLTVDNPAPYSSGELSTEENGFFLRGDVNNDSLMDQLDSENQSRGAMASWYSENGRGKNEGNIYLNPSWKP